MTKSLAPITIWAAGSLSLPLSRFPLNGRRGVAFRFGPSGHLRGLIEAWARPEIFISASPAHCRRLVDLGLAPWERSFAANDMVILARRGGPATPEELLSQRLAISTPGADPSGDYALVVFDRLEEARPGLGRALQAHAEWLMGHPAAPQAPAGKSPYAMALTQGLTDAFVTYRSNAMLACAEAADLTFHDLPPEARVRADFALCPIGPPMPATLQLIEMLCGDEMGRHLQGFGFAPVQIVSATGR